MAQIPNAKRVVVVGLGMVGIAFREVFQHNDTPALRWANSVTATWHREKLLKYDARTREYNITVLGEESHLAYNRVGLTSFFEHRKIENLYLNPAEWVMLPGVVLRSMRRC